MEDRARGGAGDRVQWGRKSSEALTFRWSVRWCTTNLTTDMATWWN